MDPRAAVATVSQQQPERARHTADSRLLCGGSQQNKRPSAVEPGTLDPLISRSPPHVGCQHDDCQDITPRARAEDSIELANLTALFHASVGIQGHRELPKRPQRDMETTVAWAHKWFRSANGAGETPPASLGDVGNLGNLAARRFEASKMMDAASQSHSGRRSARTGGKAQKQRPRPPQIEVPKVYSKSSCLRRTINRHQGGITKSSANRAPSGRLWLGLSAA